MQKAEDQKEVSRGKSLVVSIHDVSPATRERTEEILGDLNAAGIGRVSLLVIPDHHYRGLISENPDFAAWLKTTGKRGCSPRILSPSRKPEDGRIVDPPDRAFLHGRRRRISRPRKSTGPTFSRPGKSVAGDLWRERQRIHCSRMAARRGRGTGGSGGGISIHHKNFHRGRFSKPIRPPEPEPGLERAGRVEALVQPRVERPAFSEHQKEPADPGRNPPARLGPSTDPEADFANPRQGACRTQADDL